MKKHEHYYKLLDAVEEERKHEEAFYSKLNQSKSIKEKVDLGFAIYPLQIDSAVYTVGQQIEVMFEFDPAKEHRLRVGVGCQFYEQHEPSTLFTGVVSFRRKNKIKVICSSSIQDISELPTGGKIALELVYDERPYRLMRQALQQLIKSEDPYIQELRDGLPKGISFDEELYVENGADSSNVEHNTHLNESQKKAVQTMIKAKNIGIIHGPPGTGKTTTIVSLVKEVLQSEKQVLICAPSNVAVDVLTSRLHSAGVSAIRLGHPSRIHDDIVDLSLDNKISEHSEWSRIKKIRIEASEARKMAGSYKRKFGREERQNRRALYKESRDLLDWARELEGRIMQEVLNNAQVICSTLVGSAQSILNGRHFKTLIIDEASQALEPECWLAMLKAEKMILVGDHQQLPPTVKSTKAMELGLSTTLLEQYIDQLHFVSLLQVQYRMHEDILSFSNDRFYQGALTSDAQVAKRSYSQFPLTLVDTSGTGFNEEVHEDEHSYFNSGEAFILMEILRKENEDFKNLEIGVLSPYAAQIKYLEEQLFPEFGELDLEVKSIDGFQGQEKDVIILSLVRSNDDGTIGFLKNEKRLNVALTRAKQKVIVIGDFATLGQSEFFEALANHFEKNGEYKSAWEYMG